MKTMNHKAYQESLKAKTKEMLLYTIKDAGEAIAAMPDNKNNAYYSDEICYCVNELNRRL